MRNHLTTVTKIRLLITSITLLATVTLLNIGTITNANLTTHNNTTIKRNTPTFLASSAIPGVRTKSVKHLQKRLKILKFLPTRTKITNRYNKRTIASVKKVQQHLGYTGTNADGILGPLSAKFLGLQWVNDKTNTHPTPYPTATLTPTALKTTLSKAGFKDDNLITAWAIVMRESRANPTIIGAPNSDGTRDYGLFQLNDVHRTKFDFNQILNADYNTQCAYTLSSGGKNFTAWAIGTTGWAGWLQRNYPNEWKKLNDEITQWRAKFPH